MTCARRTQRVNVQKSLQDKCKRKNYIQVKINTFKKSITKYFNKIARRQIMNYKNKTKKRKTNKPKRKSLKNFPIRQFIGRKNTFFVSNGRRNISIGFDVEQMKFRVPKNGAISFQTPDAVIHRRCNKHVKYD